MMSGKALKVFSFESLPFSEHCFFLSGGLISSTEVPLETLIFELLFRLKRGRFFFLATETYWCERSKKCYAIWFISLFKINFLRNFRFQLLHQDPNWLFMEFSKTNRLKSSRFSLLHQNPDCTKVAITDVNTDLTCSSNMIFCVATDLVSVIKISIKILTIVEDDSIERFLLFLH